MTTSHKETEDERYEQTDTALPLVRMARGGGAPGVSACGSSTSDRALSGAGIGAGVGTVGGFLVGAPVQGAVIGGAVGAGAGALADEDQINLGKPIWK